MAIFMNSLEHVKNNQNMNASEQATGITNGGVWHAKYKDSTCIHIEGLPLDVTQNDIRAIFRPCGDVADVNLVRDKATGKFEGFAFLAYKDEESTVLAVKHLNGTRVVGSTIKVDRVEDYKKLQEDEIENQ